MLEVVTSTVPMQETRKLFIKNRSEYYVDLWRECKKRWMVFGVLISVALAVLCPHIGAPGGRERFALRTEALRYASLWYIYYAGGRRTGAGLGAGLVQGLRGVRARLPVLSALHAHAAAPALYAAATLALRDLRLDPRLLQGALVARSRGPCGWLALTLGRSSAPVAPALVALNYALSLLAAPLSLLFFCGHMSLPPLRIVLWTVLTTLVPFALGCCRPCRRTDHTTSQLLALLLLYIECCALLRDAEGSLYVGDVMATLFLEVSSVWLLAAGCALYARCGVLRRRESRALALAAVPKALGFGSSFAFIE
ncbi:unnamed protein product [Parnassius apollo]|uniref:(apollo) hypothetical protein n=1 Tax=Parnassius apollo TaxID=110799 RepID=A0A8S3WA66_PARAO|nr:unnamed protein product [Parnassius apollo]